MYNRNINLGSYCGAHIAIAGARAPVCPTPLLATYVRTYAATGPGNLHIIIVADVSVFLSSLF